MPDQKRPSEQAGAALVARYDDPPAVAEVIRCVRCWVPVTDADDLIRTPFAATGQPSVAHRDCPEEGSA